MNTFKKATKRITTVAATAALVSSAVFGAGLSSYPSNFVKSGEFNGTVVIGSTADSAAATSIISDLASELSEDSEKVKITAKMTSTDGGDIVSATDDKETLNFGTTGVGFNVEELDEDSTDLLADSDLDAKDYEQTLIMESTNAEFDYRLFDEVDANDATDGLYFSNGADFATYTLTFTDALGLNAATSHDDNQRYVGETLTIMGNEFTVLEISLSELTLVGGSNKVSLGEGESSTVSVDGVSYEVEVQSVSTDKILLTINGESKSVDFDEVETVAGVTVGITEIVDSERDAVKGYATLVIGGQKIKFDGSNEIELNDEDFTDVYEEYETTNSWDGTTLSITYSIDDEILLSEGDSLDDVLFDSFTLSYDGVNDVDYNELVITSDKDSVDFAGNLYNGNAIPSEFMVSADETVTWVNRDVFVLGADDERIFFSGSQDLTTGTVATLDGVTIDGLTAVGYTAPVSAVAPTATITVSGTTLVTSEDAASATIDIDGTTVNVDLSNTVNSNDNVATEIAAAITGEGTHSAVAVGSVVTVTHGTVSAVPNTNTMTTTNLIAAMDLVDGDDNDTGLATTAFSGGVTVVSEVLNQLNFDIDAASLDLDGQLFFTQETAKEDMHLYQITSSDDNGVDSEISIDDLISSSDYNDKNADDLASDLESNTFSNPSAENVNVVVSALSENTAENRNGRTGTDSTLYLENEMLLNFEDIENGNTMTFSYSTDADADDESILDNEIIITLAQVQDGLNVDDTEAIKMTLGGDVVTGEELSDDSDYDFFVDAYGTKVTFETEDFNSVKIEVPEEEVHGAISFNFGTAGSSVETYTVDADMADAKVAELEEAGYTVSTESMTNEAVDFDITAPVMADEVSGMEDMIVVGGPAVNAVAVALLGEGVVGVTDGEAVVRYFADSNSVLVYGWDAAGTQAAANKLNAGGLTGEEVNVQ